MSKIQNESIHQFINTDESVLNTFRTLLLFGKNSATYKFAFCHALLKQKARTQVSYQCQLATKTDPPLARKIDPLSSFIF